MPQHGRRVRAEDRGRPASDRAVHDYVQRAFGSRLGEVRAAMERLARSYAPDDLNRVGFQLYEQFRPEVPVGVRGWGAKDELRLEKILGARV